MFRTIQPNIQLKPTPNIWEGRRPNGPNLYTSGPNMYALVSVVSIVPVIAPTQTELVPTGFALQSCVVTGAQVRSITDSANSSYALQSVISIVPITQSQIDAVNGGYALDSVVKLTPITQSKTDAADVGYALQSVSI